MRNVLKLIIVLKIIVADQIDLLDWSLVKKIYNFGLKIRF